MYGSVGKTEENMNETRLELLVHEQPSPSDEEMQQNLSIFRKKFAKGDWDEVSMRLKMSRIK